MLLAAWQDFLFKQPPIAVGLTTLACIIVLSGFLRRWRGCHVMRPEFPDAVFLEKWRSGRSLRNFLSFLGGARNCIWVAIDDGMLKIGPHFPFTLMFLPEVYGLDYRIPVINVLAAKSLGNGWVSIRIRHPSEKEETVEVQLKQDDRFVSLLDRSG